MKSSDQTANPTKSPAKARALKSTSRKKTGAAKRSSRVQKKSPLHGQSTFAGYSDSAARLIARGKSAFGDAYAWAGEVGGAIPKSARHMTLPNSNALKALIEDKPLILGAAGLGTGVVLGSMLPAAFNGTSAKRPVSRRK
jgi:hypothetical protein